MHTCKAGCVLIVAERCARAVDLVGSDLLALPGAPYDDADIGGTTNDVAGTGSAIDRVVDRIGAVGAEVVHFVAELMHVGQHCQLEHVAGVVIVDRDLHGSHF